VVFADVGFEFVEGAREVVGRSVVGEEQSQQGLDFDAWRLGSRPCPLLERVAALGRDLVDVAAAVDGLLFVRGRVAELDELLGCGVEETFRFGSGVTEAALGLLGEFVPRPWSQVEKC